MTRASIEKLIDDDIVAAFSAMDQLDWRDYQGSFKELKEKWVDLPQGSSKTSFRSQLKTLLSLHFSAQLQPTFPETHFLTPPPFIPELFLGRNSDLDAVYHKLFHEENHLLLVNGQGGIGKTTLAAKYWERYKSQYSHVAWVFAGDDLAQALLALAPKLKLSFPETLPNAERLPLLIQELCALDKPCLLIIDNANDLPELEKHYLALRSCSNFHILLTSRITEFEQAARHAIQPLEQDVAIDLFQRYYPRYQPSEEALLRQILSAVGYNTLVIELLAKNLRNLNKLREQYSLQQLLQDLQSKGLLSITKSSSVNTGYQAHGALRQANPEAIIAAMYELGDLSQAETQLLCVFAVLPAERIELSVLEKLLPGTLSDEPLSRLAQLGWLEFEEQDSSFKISPVVQQIVRQQNLATLKTDCLELIEMLIKQLEPEGSSNYAAKSFAPKLISYATALIPCFKELDYNIALLCEKVGIYYLVTGNLSDALHYFEQFHVLINELCTNHPQIIDFKKSLTSSYAHLGLIYSDLNKPEKALTYFEQNFEIVKELYLSYPENVDFKKALAKSYKKLGDIHFQLGPLSQALNLFEQYNALESELHKKYPQNVEYKNALAGSFERLGSTHLRLDNLPLALTYYEQYNVLEKVLYTDYPEKAQFKNDLAMSHCKLGMLYLLENNPSAALNEFTIFHKLCQDLNAQFPMKIDFWANYAEALAVFAALRQLQGENALVELATAQAFFEQMQQQTGREYYAQKSALVAQMQKPDADLRALIIELAKS